MSGEEGHGERYAPVWGILLLFLGLVFLLQTLDVLPWALWRTLWRFWPVLLVGFGLSILLRRHSVWLVSAAIVSLLFACLGIAIWQHGSSSSAGELTKAYSEPVGSLEEVLVEIDFTEGGLTVSSLPPVSFNLVEVGSEGGDGDRGMKVDFHREGSGGELHLSREQSRWSLLSKGENEWQVRLSRNIPMELAVKSTGSDVELDLGELQVTDLTMDVFCGSYRIELPSLAGTVRVHIEAEFSNLEIAIPHGVAAKVIADVDLSVFKVDESRFPGEGDYYVSRDFESAKNRVQIELDCDLSRVRVG